MPGQCSRAKSTTNCEKVFKNIGLARVRVSTDAIAAPHRWCPAFAPRSVGLTSTCQHQIQVLHRRPRGTLAQVVKHGGQQHLTVAGVAEHPQLQPVGAVQGLRVQMLGRFGGGGGASRR